MTRPKAADASVRSVMLIAALLMGGCSLPRDPSGTTDRVQRSHTLRLGIVSGLTMDGPGKQTLADLLRFTASQPRIVRGDSEDLLVRLKEGRLDLVYGEFPMSSPWSKEVHFGHPQGRLGRVAKGKPVLRYAMMNGENGWIMLVREAGK